MKAAQVKKYGNAEVIEIVNIEKPKVVPGQVLVKVFSSSLNPIDTKMREGLLNSNLPLPFVLGSDIAGVVTELGKGVLDLRVGENVYGQAIVLAGGSGAFAEFARVPSSMVSRMPKNIDFNQAAAVVLTGVSAVQAILEHFHLKAGQKILIHGGAGGIGTVAIQIAKNLGAQVATTATGEGIEYVKKLGADLVVDYSYQKFEEMLSDYDAVFDTVGGQVYEKSFVVLKKGGMLVSMVESVNEKLEKRYRVKAISQFTKVNTGHLALLTKLIEKNEVFANIDKIYSLDKIKEAFNYKEKENVLGKVVVEIRST